MLRWTLALAPALALGGCIIYDTNGKCRDCSDEQGGHGDHDDTGIVDSGGAVDDTGVTDTGGQVDDTSSDPSADMKLSLTPNVGTAGTTFIAHLTSDQASFDWSLVSDVSFYGGVQVIASEPEPTELLLTLNIPSDALAGTADLLVATSDGRAFFMSDALTIQADPNGSTDTGGCQ